MGSFQGTCMVSNLPTVAGAPAGLTDGSAKSKILFRSSI